jgi:hypothetical protein
LKPVIVPIARFFHEHHFTSSPTSSCVTSTAEKEPQMRDETVTNYSLNCYLLHPSDDGEIPQYGMPLVASKFEEFPIGCTESNVGT